MGNRPRSCPSHSKLVQNALGGTRLQKWYCAPQASRTKPANRFPPTMLWRFKDLPFGLGVSIAINASKRFLIRIRRRGRERRNPRGWRKGGQCTLSGRSLLLPPHRQSASVYVNNKSACLSRSRIASLVHRPTCSSWSRIISRTTSAFKRILQRRLSSAQFVWSRRHRRLSKKRSYSATRHPRRKTWYTRRITHHQRQLDGMPLHGHVCGANTSSTYLDRAILRKSLIM